MRTRWIRLVTWVVISVATAAPASATWTWSDLQTTSTTVTVTGASWDTGNQWQQAVVYSEFSYWGFDSHSASGPGYAENTFTVQRDSSCTLYSILSDHYGMLEDGGWMYQGTTGDGDYLCGSPALSGDYANVYVHDGIIQDGNDTTAEVEGQFSPTSFSWSANPVNSGAGNSPQVNFQSPSAQSTGISNAHWYAYPNLACGANAYSADTLKAQIQLTNGQTWLREGEMGVRLPSEAGSTGFDAVDLYGTPDIIQIVPFLYRLNGPGSMGINAPVSANVYLSPSSQFYYKTQQHELKHKTDLEGQYYRFSDFLPMVQGILGVSQSGVVSQMLAQWYNFVASETARKNANSNQREHDAYAISDSISPQYLYQNCGRF